MASLSANDSLGAQMLCYHSVDFLNYIFFYFISQIYLLVHDFYHLLLERERGN